MQKKFRLVAVSALFVVAVGVLAFLLRTNALLFQSYTMPGLIVGETILRVVGSDKHITPVGGPAHRLLPLLILSCAVWSIFLALVIGQKTYAGRARLTLGILSIFWLNFFAGNQLSVAGGGITSPGEYPFPFRSLREDHFYLSPIIFFAFLCCYCLPGVSRRVSFWVVVAATGFVLPAIVESYELGNFSAIAGSTLLLMAGLAFFVHHSDHRTLRSS